MGWFREFSDAASKTDRFTGLDDHCQLLLAGIVGESGSIVAEVKKERRELDAYPAYRERMLEEIGDLLWYFTRLVATIQPSLIQEFDRDDAPAQRGSESDLDVFLRLASVVGQLGDVVDSECDHERTSDILCRIWRSISTISKMSGARLEDLATKNLQKTASRWPSSRVPVGLYDGECEEEEQLPRELTVEFRQRVYNGSEVVFLRCNGLNFGDRLTDNIEGIDGYRFHDIFHFSYAVFLGWSPVVRALLRCKRKSLPKKDEGQDGARATILEEAVSAIVFSRAKGLSNFEGLKHVDFDLLKVIREFVSGYEVDSAPFWQWEEAILEGYRIFRLLKQNGGGIVHLNMHERTLKYVAPSQA